MTEYECRDPDNDEEGYWWKCSAKDAQTAAELYAEEHEVEDYYHWHDGRVLVRHPVTGRESIWTVSGETTTVYSATETQEAE